MRSLADCKLFVIRNKILSEKLKDTELTLPLSIKINNPNNKNLMVAANCDGPNFGFNVFFIEDIKHIYAYNCDMFESPVDDISYVELLTNKKDEETYPMVVGMEVFTLQSIEMH